LFAKYLHPDYIYNIGRCYQNMGDPDKALQSFHEYVRKAKHVDPELRKELDGHVKEMEALRAQRDSLTNKLAATDHDEPSEEPLANAKSPDKPMKLERTAKATPPTGAHSKTDAPSDATVVDLFLAQMRATPEKFWRERALKVDEGKLAKTVGLVKNARPGDPRLADYNLHLATQYAGKHFSLRLQELESRSDKSQESHKVTTGERKLGPEISATFTSAAGYYVAASDHRDFAKMDEALLGLAVLLEANNMESRSRNVLQQLLRNFPQSKHSEAVRNTGQDE
jgi:tetratricopeptide (TPR) repeat protein